MLVTDARTPVRYTPPWLAEQSDPPVFLIRAGTVIERDLFEADLAGRFNARVVYAHELREAIQSGVRHIAEPDSYDRLLEVGLAGIGGTLSTDGDKALFANLEAMLCDNWAPYQALNKRLEIRRAIIPPLAFLKFCVGWEFVFAIDDGEPLVFARDGLGLVDQAVVRRLDPLLMRAAGNFAFQLLTPTPVQIKNSAPPSRSGGAPRTSTSPPRKPASTPRGARKAGSSTASAGGKTPAAKSPKTSGRS